jgi:hypothetical protein
MMNDEGWMTNDEGRRTKKFGKDGHACSSFIVRPSSLVTNYSILNSAINRSVCSGVPTLKRT